MERLAAPDMKMPKTCRVSKTRQVYVSHGEVIFDRILRYRSRTMRFTLSGASCEGFFTTILLKQNQSGSI
jgi:hypothetical protein